MTSGPAAETGRVAVAPNGGRKTKAECAGLPITAEELAQTAAECLEQGAAMLHLHVRDGAGRPSARRRGLRARRSARSAPKSATGWSCRSPASRSAAIPRPSRWRSSSTRTRRRRRSPCASSRPKQKDEPLFGEFLERLKRLRVWPQIILYTPRRGRAPGGDAEAGTGSLRRTRGSLRARPLFAAPPRRAFRPAALSRPRHAAFRAHGASAPSAGGRRPASSPARCSAATCGSASRTIPSCRAASRRRPTPSWSALSPARSTIVGLATQDAQDLREEIARLDALNSVEFPRRPWSGASADEARETGVLPSAVLSRELAADAVSHPVEIIRPPPVPQRNVHAEPAFLRVLSRGEQT